MECLAFQNGSNVLVLVCVHVNAQLASSHSIITPPEPPITPLEMHKQHIISKHWNDSRFSRELARCWYGNRKWKNVDSHNENSSEKMGTEQRKERIPIIVLVMPKLKMDFGVDLFFAFSEFSLSLLGSSSISIFKFCCCRESLDSRLIEQNLLYSATKQQKFLKPFGDHISIMKSDACTHIFACNNEFH